MSFNDAATGIQEFNKQRDTLRMELSEIIGFDISALKKVDKIISGNKEASFRYFEQSFEQAHGFGQPIHFSIEAQNDFKFLGLTIKNRHTKTIFKSEDEWYVKGNGNLSTKGVKPSSKEDIKKYMMAWLAQLNIKLEDILDIPTVGHNQEPDNKIG